tara:strand:- start:1224 stop:1370 length:147 start_codon:yes stop_codon:yes gene_type:complete
MKKKENILDQKILDNSQQHSDNNKDKDNNNNKSTASNIPFFSFLKQLT